MGVPDTSIATCRTKLALLPRMQDSFLVTRPITGSVGFTTFITASGRTGSASWSGAGLAVIAVFYQDRRIPR